MLDKKPHFGTLGRFSTSVPYLYSIDKSGCTLSHPVRLYRLCDLKGVDRFLCRRNK